MLGETLARHVVTDGDADALLAALSALLESPTSRSVAGARARKAALARHGLTQMLDAYEQLYKVKARVTLRPNPWLVAEHPEHQRTPRVAATNCRREGTGNTNAARSGFSCVTSAMVVYATVRSRPRVSSAIRPTMPVERDERRRRKRNDESQVDDWARCSQLGNDIEFLVRADIRAAERGFGDAAEHGELASRPAPPL